MLSKLLKVCTNKKEILFAEKNTVTAITIILKYQNSIKILNISRNSILIKILYSVFSIGPYDEAYLGRAWNLRAAGDM